MKRHGRTLNDLPINKAVLNAKYYVISTVLHYGKGKTIETPKSIVVAKGLGREEE